jgi:hypothetical protein
VLWKFVRYSRIYLDSFTVLNRFFFVCVCVCGGGGGSVMVSMLAIGPKVRGFKPSGDDGFLRVIKICSTPSFRGQVKPSAPFCMIL